MKDKEVETDVQPFSYDEIDEEIASDARALLKNLEKKTIDLAFETGDWLLRLKKKMPRGTFQPWLKAEFPLSLRTAQNMMSAAARLGEQRELFSGFPAKTLYSLGAKSTPDSVRNDITVQLKQGTPISPEEIDLKIADAKYKQIKPSSTKSHDSKSDNTCLDDSDLSHSELPQKLVKLEKSPIEEFVSLIRPSIDGKHREAIALISQIDAHALVSYLRQVYC